MKTCYLSKYLGMIIFSLIILSVSSLSYAQKMRTGLTPIAEKPQAPDFTLTDIEGNEFRLSHYYGKPVVVNFWATWCSPCREEMPSMQLAWEQLEPDGILLLGIAVAEDKETVSQFIKNHPLDFTIVLDQDSKVSEAWPLRGLPTTFIVDAEGKIVYRAVGSRDWNSDEIISKIKALNESSE